METRANYVLVGFFTLAVLLSAVGFTLWIGSQGEGVALVHYDISFNESVKGLSINNDVLFTGIRVGRVSGIKMSAVTPGEVTVRVTIDSDTPVRENSTAQLELRGITGVNVISISGGTVGSPLIRLKGSEVGHIKSEPSPISSMVNRMPEILNAVNGILQRLEVMFSDENSKSVNEILTSLAQITSSLASASGRVEHLVKETDKIAVRFNKLLDTANDIMVTDVRGASRSFSTAAKRVDSTLQAAEPAVKRFSAQGMNDARLLLSEMRNLVRVYTRVGQKIENDPKRFFFGEPVKEYKR